MAPLPASSPRQLLHSNSIEHHVVLLLLVLSTIFVSSVLYSSGGFGAMTTTGRLVPGDKKANGLNVPADNGVARPQSPAADISLTSAPSAPAVSTADEAGGDQSGIRVEEQCDMSLGKWVSDLRGPVYTNLTCPTLPDTRNCQKYGKDPGHLFWRWQPDGCDDLPRFSPERFLAVVRGKRLAFIGDSLARNQMESLLCLLSQAEPPALVDRDASHKFVTWRFPAHDFTLMVMWTEFYAHAVPVLDAEGKPTVSYDIHLDRINANWTTHLPGLDYAVLSGGNWFFRVNYLWEDGRRVGCVNCREANLTDFGIPYAVRRVVRAALEAVAGCEDCKSSLVTFLRTYMPEHFEHGSWFSGGRCDRTRPLEEEEVDLTTRVGWELRSVQGEEVIRAARAATGSKRFGVLDVTRSMMLRADGHIGAHADQRWARNASDCLHWCLPGPIDTLNSMLLQKLVEVSPSPVVW